MKLKNDNVSLQSLAPQLVLALMICNEVYNEYGVELVITSVNDSKHSLTSLHYSGNAADLRIRTLPDGTAEGVAEAIRDKLNQDFDVVLEPTHIHLEYQPRGRS